LGRFRLNACCLCSHETRFRVFGHGQINIRSRDSVALVRYAVDDLERIKARKLAEMIERAHKRDILPQTGTIAKLTDSEFETVIRTNKLVVVDCWAAWCYPCRMISPIFEELARKYGSSALFAKLNVDENPMTTSKYYIQSIPTILVLGNGVEVERIVGALPREQIEATLKRHLAQSS